MSDENIHIGKLLKQYVQYWKIYIPIGIICLIGAIIYILITPKEYGITAQIQLIGKQSGGMMSELKMLKSTGIGALMGGGGSGGVNTNDEILLMTSRQNMTDVILETQYQVKTTVKRALKTIALDKDISPIIYKFPPQFLDTLSKPIEIKVKLADNSIKKITVESELFNDIIIKSQALPYNLNLPVGTINIIPNGNIDGSYTTEITPLQKTYEDLLEEVHVFPSDKMSDILTLECNSTNKKIDCDMLNAMINQYNIYSKEIKISDSKLNSAFVQERLDTVTAELALLEHRIEKYKQENNIPDPILYGEATYMGSKEIEKTVLETETRLRMLDYILSYMNDPANTYSAVPMIDEGGENAIILYNELILNRQKLLQSSEKNNPALLLAENQLKEQRKMLFESMESIRENVKITLNALNQKNSSLVNLINKLPTQEREYIEMNRQQKIKEAMYLFLMQKLQEKELVNSPDEFASRVIDSAYASYKHVFPKGSIILIIAFIISCILSITIISFKVFSFKTK